LDAGASTGGFTQVLLERGAQAVAAVDVGYGQLAWSLRSDERVSVLERTNVRHIHSPDLPFAPDVVVADLSFISLRKVLPALVRVAAERAQWILMVKPQFEAGRAKVKAGVVRDPDVRVEAVASVAQAGRDSGLVVRGVAASPLPGPKGNVEYFLWMRRSGGGDGPDEREDGVMDEQATAEAIVLAVHEGPA
jgi:23S rRNA (cytidine1920-2'-O)/16S rRNA (cytidine1409-2'-O)-methyltransferase